MREVVIVGAKRTPIGSFGGGLSSIAAPQLGSIAIKAAMAEAGVKPEMVDEVLMGNVLQAGVGQAPARQAALGAGIPNTVPCTTVNKVCSSGMKAIMQGTQAVMLGDADVVIAGGMENMSNVPHYLHGRNAVKLGDIKAQDGLLKDGLMDVYNGVHMGNCAELCAGDMSFTREEQDAFAINSYKRAAEAWSAGKFKNEVTPVSVPQRKGDPIEVNEDEDFTKVNFDKIPQLRPVFDKEGTITAANASNINDGAAAVVLMSLEKANELGITPLAKISGYADAAQSSEWFTTSPALAVPKAIAKAGITADDISYYELNEAFSVVGLANMKLLNIEDSVTNVNGGAVSIGHPLGASGARIVITLLNVLKQNQAKYGAAGICNGGGGASAMVIEAL